MHVSSVSSSQGVLSLLEELLSLGSQPVAGGLIVLMSRHRRCAVLGAGGISRTVEVCPRDLGLLATRPDEVGSSSSSHMCCSVAWSLLDTRKLICFSVTCTKVCM